MRHAYLCEQMLSIRRRINSVTLGKIIVAISSGTSAYTVAFFSRSGDVISETDHISTGGRGSIGQMSISSSGTYLAKVSNTGTSRLIIYKKTSGVWNILTTGVPTITEVGMGVAFSLDETYIAVGSQVANRLRVFKRSSDDFTTACTIVNQPVNSVTECAWSPSGNFVFVAVASSPYITAYSRSGDTFTRMAYPSSLPTGQGNGIAVNPSGDVVVVAHNNSPYFKAYYFDGSTLANLTTISASPDGIGVVVKFSPDGLWCAVGLSGGSFMIMYAVSGTGAGTTFTKQTVSSGLPPAVNGLDFDSSSTYLAVSHTVSSGIGVTLYKLVSGTWTRIQQTNLTTGSNNPQSLIWDKDR